MQKYEYAADSIKAINADGFSVPFDSDNFGFFVVSEGKKLKIGTEKSGDEYIGVFKQLRFSYSFSEHDSYLAINLNIENTGEDFFGKIVFGTGVDSFMTHYPQWNEKFFPTLMRCEKTHIWGYYMNTDENALAFTTDRPIASYDILYNIFYEENYPHNGHRILGTDLVLTDIVELPERCPQNLKGIKSGEIYTNTIFYLPVRNKADIKKSLAEHFDIPLVDASKYTVEKGEALSFTVLNNETSKISLFSPAGEEITDICDALTENGMYILRVTARSGKECEASFYVRRSWNHYLEKASENTFSNPQKASTHVESFYGLFSAFLQYKHSGDKELYDRAMAVFEEIMPLMFDFERGVPLVIPERIQNTAGLISLLCDIYEANPAENTKYLEYASVFAEFLMSRQTEDGAYRSKGTHYTCVIYIAKSLLELALCERNSAIPDFVKKSEIHYQSVTKAVDELVSHLDNIETEGEMTLEDGMISCSALQIAMYALTLEADKRVPYIEAAKYMMKIHSCLEQQLVPDCRINGASLRYWEAQYDVMFRANMLNSPHGWTGWTAYAHYYLYMLTGEASYLLSLMNCLGACSQLVSESGELRWAYCPQPFVRGEAMVPDETQEIKDGLTNIFANQKAYRGRYTTKQYGEEYVEMISSWYRTGKEKLTGGYEFCYLYLPDKVIKDIDNQGGCCDNDVHEIFKCIEETVMDKAFIHQNDDGSFLTFGCRYEDGNISLINNEKTLIYKFDTPSEVCINDRHYTLCGFGTIKNI